MDFQIICSKPENILADLLGFFFFFFNKICVGLLGMIRRGFPLISVFFFVRWCFFVAGTFVWVSICVYIKASSTEKSSCIF